jgi:hypothetical protein
MKQVIAYRLLEGTIPTFVSDGGYYSNNDLLVGISVNGLPLPEYVSVFSTKEELITYLNTFSDTWTYNPAFPDRPVKTVAEAADEIWAKL